MLTNLACTNFCLTEQPTLLDLELVNNRSTGPKSNTGGGGYHAGNKNLRGHPGLATNTPPQKPQFGLRWKMFELYAMEGSGRVCLVFPPKPDPPPVAENGGIQLDISPPTPQVNNH